MMVFAISRLWNRYLDAGRFKKDRQGRRRWWLQNDACTVPGFDYRISSPAISTLHAEREKEGTIDLKFLLSITFLSFFFFIYTAFFPIFTVFSVTNSRTSLLVNYFHNEKNREIEIKEITRVLVNFKSKSIVTIPSSNIIISISFFPP